MTKRSKNPGIGEERKSSPPTYLITAIKRLMPTAAIKFLSLGGRNEYTFLIKFPDATTINIPHLDKILLPKGQFIIKFGQYAKYEIEILKKLSDLNLLPHIYHVNHTFIIMKFIHGIDIRNYMKDEKWDILFKNYIAKKATEELEKWHKAGFFHGDIAFRNIVISTTGEVYLIDPDIEKYLKIKTKKEIDDYMKDDVLDLKRELKYLLDTNRYIQYWLYEGL